eukprot:11201887-Lingulodinium_polyedra.AAC.1
MGGGAAAGLLLGARFVHRAVFQEAERDFQQVAKEFEAFAAEAAGASQGSYGRSSGLRVRGSAVPAGFGAGARQ